MTSIVTPTNQKISIDPYTSRIFDFNNVSSKVYLTRTINNLLNVFGNNVVLEGLEIINLMIGSNNVVYLTVLPGKCIIDTTLVEFLDNTNLTMDCSGYDNNGSLILTISFQFTESIHSNDVKLKLFYMDSSNNITYPELFEPHIDQIILAQIFFNKNTQEAHLSTMDTVDIKGEVYNIRPTHNFHNNMKDFVLNIFN